MRTLIGGQGCTGKWPGLQALLQVVQKHEILKGGNQEVCKESTWTFLNREHY